MSPKFDIMPESYATNPLFSWYLYIKSPEDSFSEPISFPTTAESAGLSDCVSVLSVSTAAEL